MKAVNLLKMKVSYGHLGYAGDTDFFSIEQIGDKGIRRNSNLVRGPIQPI